MAPMTHSTDLLPDTGLDDGFAVTGVVLAGGQGRRMGGQDKGLQLLDGQPLARIVLQRLAPQVDRVAINANRHLDRYRQWSPEVWRDADFDAEAPVFDGPLAGVLTALTHGTTDWIQLAACDTPFFPHDLVRRLRYELQRPIDAAKAAAQAKPLIAVPATHDADGHLRHHPTFALVHRSQQSNLCDFLAAGDRKVMRWIEAQAHTVVVFDDAAAFANLNTPDDLLAAAPLARQHLPSKTAR